MKGTKINDEAKMTGITGVNVVMKAPPIAKFDPMNKKHKQPGRGFDTVQPKGMIPDYKKEYDGR